jgi:hypothetical protein
MNSRAGVLREIRTSRKFSESSDHLLSLGPGSQHVILIDLLPVCRRKAASVLIFVLLLSVVLLM